MRVDLSQPATRGDVIGTGQTLHSAIVALIATLIQQHEPHRLFVDCVRSAISRVQAVDDPSTPIE